MNDDGIRNREAALRRISKEKREKAFSRYQNGALNLSDLNLYDNLIGCPVPVLSETLQGFVDNRGVFLPGPPIDLWDNPNLKSLEGIPAITYRVVAAKCGLSNLEYAPVMVLGSFDAKHNRIRSLEGIGKRYLRELNGSLYLQDNPIEGHVLGLMIVKGLHSVHFNGFEGSKMLEDITDLHLTKDRDIMDYQEDLIRVGLKRFARL